MVFTFSYFPTWSYTNIGIKKKEKTFCTLNVFIFMLTKVDIYLVKNELGHESVTTTEKYAKFSLRRLESDFPSLVNSIKSGEILEMGYEKVGYTSTSVSVNSTILGV